MTEDFDIHEERLSKGEKEFENALRPLRFDDFNGQPKVVENLEIFVEDDRIILKKYQPGCIFCGNVGNTELFKGKLICSECKSMLKN